MLSDTETIKNRYNRIAPFYDALEYFMEKTVFGDLREQIWQKVNGQTVLEAGVGTVKNFPFYPENKNITAIDFSDRMLVRAKHKRIDNQLTVDLQLMDVESLNFPDNSFDTIIATFLFCSVPRPITGLRELHRVCKPGGQVLLLEHVLSENPLLAGIMKFLNPLVAKLVGANIDRETVKSVQSIGFQRVHVDSVSGGIVKLIEAIK